MFGLVLLPLLAGGCAAVSNLGGGSSLTCEWAWQARTPHPALVAGAWVRERHVKNLDPLFSEAYVGADWRDRLVATEDELLPLLRPVADGPSALALLDLVHRVHVRGGQLPTIRESLPLALEDGAIRDPCTEPTFEASDARRWGIATRPDVEVGDGHVVVRRAVWRPYRPGEAREADDPYDPQDLDVCVPGVVEWVADTITREGVVRRKVLRVLETGRSAHRFGPMRAM